MFASISSLDCNLYINNTEGKLNRREWAALTGGGSMGGSKRGRSMVMWMGRAWGCRRHRDHCFLTSADFKSNSQ